MNHLVDGTVMLTGASAGIGRATAELIAGQTRHLILQGHEPEAEVESFIAGLRSSQGPGGRIDYFRADYSELATVVALAAHVRSVTGRLDVLINNAGRPGAKSRSLTSDGNEATLQVNYLAPVLLTSALLAGPGVALSRVVNVASATHLSASLHLEDLDWADHPYADSAAYASSKLALVTYSGWLAANPPGPGFEAVSMHPGVISTFLLHSMFAVEGAAPETAAANVAYVAGRTGDSGDYYDERAVAPPAPTAADPRFQQELHDLTTARLSTFLWEA